jgi:hypothetical protein
LFLFKLLNRKRWTQILDHACQILTFGGGASELSAFMRVWLGIKVSDKKAAAILKIAEARCKQRLENKNKEN